MTSKKWTILCCTILFGFIFFIFLDVCDIHQQWLHQEDLSNLKRQEGILKLTHSLKNNRYYIKMKNGKTYGLEFVTVPMSKFKVYEGESVTIWKKKGRYVYQMEVDGNLVFSIDEANDGIFLYNYVGIMIDLLWLCGILWIMFSVYYFDSSEEEK